jgi:hypothetical protein
VKVVAVGEVFTVRTPFVLVTPPAPTINKLCPPEKVRAHPFSTVTVQGFPVVTFVIRQETFPSPWFWLPAETHSGAAEAHAT